MGRVLGDVAASILMTRHPIHLKRKKMRKQYTRELKYDHQRQSVSHFEKYMYLLLFSLNYIVIPNPAFICSFKHITTLVIYAKML